MPYSSLGAGELVGHTIAGKYEKVTRFKKVLETKNGTN